jgi:hypothetical protein
MIGAVVTQLGAADRTADEVLSSPMAVAKVAGWTTHFTKEQRVYYYHAESKRSVWKKPAEMVEAELAAQLRDFGSDRPEAHVRDEVSPAASAFARRHSMRRSSCCRAAFCRRNETYGRVRSRTRVPSKARMRS